MPAGAQYVSGKGVYICLLHGPYIYLYDEGPSPEDWEGDRSYYTFTPLPLSRILRYFPYILLY